MAKRKMIKHVKYHHKSESSSGNLIVKLDVDLSRFEKQYQNAQYALDSMVMDSMVPYMPHQTGSFINVTRAKSAALAGSGIVVAAASPMGRFLYEGKVMVDPETGSPWARAGAKKIVTDKNLEYDKSHHPNATDNWFNAAKKNHGKSWVAEVKRIAGGG